MTAKPEPTALTPGMLGPMTFLAELAPLPLVNPTEAARFLDVERHSLACYRSLGEGPPYYKFGRWVRYAWADLRSWRDSAATSPLQPLGEPTPNDMRLVDAATAACYLTVTRACLRNYRLEGLGPRFCRLRRRLHYPIGELSGWAERQRHDAGAQLFDTLSKQK